MVSLNNAPLFIAEKAVIILSQYRKGCIHPRRTFGKKYLTFRVNKRWRLLSRDNGQKWELLTHNDYNNVIDK